MSAEKYSTIWQHEQIRVPEGWSQQERMLVTQMNNIFTDIYKRFGRLGLKDLNKDVRGIVENVDGYPALPDTPTQTRYLRDDGTFQTPSSIVDIVYPVGSIYMSTNNVDPGALFGGTWQAIEGKFLLSKDSSHTAGDTGGAASVSYTPAGTNSGGSVSNHTLTTAQIPVHSHTFTGSAVASGDINANHTHTGTSGNPSANHTHSGPSHNHSINTNNTWSKAGNSAIATGNAGSNNTKSSVDAGTGATGTVSAWHTHTTTTGNQSGGHKHSVTAAGSIGNSGSGNAHNHGFTNPTFSGTAATIATMPPYLVVYMWKRTA
jgi:hypothetical protein